MNWDFRHRCDYGWFGLAVSCLIDYTSGMIRTLEETSYTRFFVAHGGKSVLNRVVLELISDCFHATRLRVGQRMIDLASLSSSIGSAMEGAEGLPLRFGRR